EAEVLRRQREGEKKKAANKGKGREQDLQTKFDDVQHRKKHLKELMKEIFDAVFVLRYRDADPGIRAECVQEFGVWVEKYPAFFLESNHLRYIGWVLSDTNTQVRLAAVKSLYSLYKRDELLVSTNHFTQRYKPRLVAMAASDVEVSVRVAVIQVLCAIDALGELEEDQTEQMELLIFDQEPRVRKAISSFVHGVWKNAVDERLGRRRQGGDAEKDRSRAGFKCLGSLLVKWAKKLEKDEEGDAVPDQTESQEGASESGAGGHKSKEVTALVSDLQRGRIALCVDSLWDEVDAVSDWEDLIEFLLLDHSAEGEDDVSPVASKRKRAAEANAKKGKGRRKSTVNEAEVDEAWRLEDSEEAALVEVLVASLKKTIGDAAEKKKILTRCDPPQSKGEADAVQADVTRALIKSLPQLFAKHQADERRISEVILIPQVMNLDLYAEMGLNKAYETLWDEVIKHFLSHSSPIVIRNATITISRLLTTSSMFGENEAKIAQLEEELSTSLRDVVAGRDDLDAAFLEDDEVHALSGFALRVESLFRVRDLSGWMDNDEDGKQSSVWNILLSLGSRGPQGHKEEESLLDHTYQVLTFQIAWKVKHLPNGDPNAEGASEAREALQRQRDMLVETLDAAAFGPNSRAGDGVRRSAVKCLLILYTLFLPKQSDGAGHPYPAASIPLEVSEEMQFRFEGFIEAEVERYADDLAEEEQETSEGDKGSDPADSDEGDGEGGENQQKKAKKVAKKNIDPDAVSQSRLEKEYVFTGTIAAFLSAMRAGIIQISHASKVLAYYGRLGMTYDQCMKVVIELLREEGMYKSRGFIVADVIKDAARESFLLYLEGRAPDDEHTLSLVKAMGAALVIRGAQLSIVQRLDGENVVTIHQELIAWVTKRIAQYEKSGNKKLRNAAIEFFHSLTQLLVSADSGDAAQIQEHLKQSLASSNLEPSATARFWEPLRSYEKRLSTIAAKDKEKAPTKGRRKSKKQSARSGDETTTDEEMGLDDVRDDEPPASPPPRPSPQRKTRSRKSLGKDVAAEEPPERPKARPRPRTRTRGQREPEPDADQEAPADEPSEPPQQVNGDLNSPQASPEPPQSLPNAHSQSPERGTGKRKRDEDLEDLGMDDDADDEEPEQSAASPPARKHHSRPSSQISQISQMDVDFFKTRKRFRR
ncbi:hypothetical protein FRC05_006541, partial [Tulasnella sp. 425]